jgi:glycerol-3-phosphate dehydrogenase
MYDIAIIGGGINGCGVARDAAGRGYSVLLAEMGDLASGTSSWSTKLIHGGLRYLEHYEFRLVAEALAEREVLLAAAPHIVSPLRFIIPHHAGLRPAWLVRAGLFLYDHIGGRRSLPGTRTLRLREEAAGAVLRPGLERGFAYSDCWVDDARLVALTARDAADRGGDIRTGLRIAEAHREGGGWSLLATDRVTGAETSFRARVLVNAAGPWVDGVLSSVLRRQAPPRTRLVKGSHIVVPRIGHHDEAFLFQNDDGRVVFVIPYEQDFSLIGTTDEEFSGDPGAARITDHEIAYLCRAVSSYLIKAVSPAEIVWSFAGVRSLSDDGATAAQEATRDYVIDVDDEEAGLLINVLGGKITTYRRLAEAVLTQIEGSIGPRTRGAWTRGSALPGGDFPVDGFEALLLTILQRWPWLDRGIARRLVRSYGTVGLTMLEGAASKADLGLDFGAGLTEREVRHLVTREWARTADDILWRRSKLGLRMTPAEVQRLEDWLGAELR